MAPNFIPGKIPESQLSFNLLSLVLRLNAGFWNAVWRFDMQAVFLPSGPPWISGFWSQWNTSHIQCVTLYGPVGFSFILLFLIYSMKQVCGLKPVCTTWAAVRNLPASAPKYTSCPTDSGCYCQKKRFIEHPSRVLRADYRITRFFYFTIVLA